MSYTPNTWQDGDIITAAKLNNMEGGIENNGTFWITLTPSAADMSGNMDKSPAQIDEAIRAGKRIMFTVPSVNATAEATQFQTETVMDGEEVERFKAMGNFVLNIAEGTYGLVQIMTGAFYQSYATQIFLLTPMNG